MADVYEFPAGRDAAGLSCPEVEAEEAAYAWGGLASGERQRVDRHRHECSACDQRLVAAERVVADLDSAGPKLAPPPELRGRVLEAVARLEQRPSGAAVSAAEAAPSTPRSAPAQAFSSGPGRELREAGPGEQGRRQPSQGGSGRLGIRELHVVRPGAPRAGPFLTGVATGVVGLAAAAALVVVLLVRPDVLGQVGTPRSQFAPSDQPAASTGITFPWQAPPASARLIELRSAAGPGRGLLAFDSQSRRGVLLLEGLPRAEGTQSADYVMWLVQGAQRVQIGAVSVDSQGVGVVVLPEPLPLERPERIEVSRDTPPGTAEGVLTGSF